MFRFFIFFFFFNDTATTEIYTLSLHDALPICPRRHADGFPAGPRCASGCCACAGSGHPRDRKSTRLNSSHLVISYAVFCLKKKKKKSTDYCKLSKPYIEKLLLNIQYRVPENLV